MRKSIFILFLLLALFVFNCSAQPVKHLAKPQLMIAFRNVVDSQEMQLGDTYKNPFNEDFTIRTFKYYISHIMLTYADGKTNVFRESHLINEADSASKFIFINASRNRLKSISFIIGVDSIYNVSGTQTGDLDPAKAMFWTWNSGYIMAKLEATSPVSTAPNNNATFHIGGFKAGQKTMRTITMNAPDSATKKAVSEIIITANANKWFNAVHPLKIADNPVCTTPGKLSVMFADNYAEMFTLTSVN